MAMRASPFAVVNAIDAVEVLTHLGVHRAKPSRKYACISCPSSDGLHAYKGGGAYCFACGTAWSNIDLAVQFRGVKAVEARRLLADAFGLGVIASLDHRAGPSTRSLTSVHGLEAMRNQGRVQATQAEMYAAMLDALTLTRDGRDYLVSRGLNADVCLALGVRSVSGPADWLRLREVLCASYCDDELALVGLRRLPWNGKASCLVLPYLFGGEINAWRFRAIDHHADFRDGKFRALSGVQIATPFNADAVSTANPESVWITEAEIDCLTLACMGETAIATPGASPSASLLHSLAFACRHVRRILLAFDADAAGDFGAHRVAKAFAVAYGAEWVRERVKRARPRERKDVNALRLANAI